MTVSRPAAASSSSSPLFSPSSACCVIRLKPLTFSPEQAAADARTILSFMAASSLRSSPVLSASHQPCAPLICRICRTEESDARLLLSPCHCSGSLASVHPACLLQWIDSRPAADPLAGGDLAALSLSSTSSSSSYWPSSSACLLGAEPFNTSAHTCELCQSPYRVSYSFAPNPLSCNRALLHLTLDCLLLGLLLAVALLLIVSLPDGTSLVVWWCSVASVAVLGVVSLALVLRRFYFRNATVTLVSLVEGVQRRPERQLMDTARQSCGGDKLMDGHHQLAANDAYVKIECGKRMSIG